MRTFILAALGAALCAATPVLAKAPAPVEIKHKADAFANTEEWAIAYEGRALYKTFNVSVGSLSGVWLYRMRNGETLSPVKVQVKFWADGHATHATLRGGERIETQRIDVDVSCGRVCNTYYTLDVPVTRETFDKYREGDNFPVQIYGQVINVPAEAMQRLFDASETVTAPAS